MTHSEIRKLIVQQLSLLRSSGNEVYVAHQDGLFRGLIWALSGKDPGSYLTSDTPTLFRAADFYHHRQDNGLIFFDEGRKVDGSTYE